MFSLLSFAVVNSIEQNPNFESKPVLCFLDRLLLKLGANFSSITSARPDTARLDFLKSHRRSSGRLTEKNLRSDSKSRRQKAHAPVPGTFKRSKGRGCSSLTFVQTPTPFRPPLLNFFFLLLLRLSFLLLLLLVNCGW